MSGPTRRVLFNPTALPNLRSQSQRSYFQHARSIPRRPVPRGSNLGPALRMESTVTGENKSGHVKTGPNEGILFFDSQFQSQAFCNTWANLCQISFH